MRWRVYLLVFGVLFLTTIGIVSGAPVADITVTPEWIVANGHDTSLITVVVTDSGNLVDGALVDFNVTTSSFGTVDPVSIRTVAGIATTTFTSKTKSGNASISVSVNGTVQSDAIIKIDHDTPYSMKMLIYPNNATVGTIQNISFQMQDIHGNIVDIRRNPEYSKFSIITVNDTSRLWNTTAYNFSNITNVYQNNESGWFNGNISIGTVPGETLVRIQPLSGGSELTITIKREANGEPYSMYFRMDPSVPYVPADNRSFFVFSITLYDKYGNGLNNKKIILNSSRGGWGPILLTTYEGKAAVVYGPFVQPFPAYITAYAIENQSVNITFPVEFYDPAPKSPFITISPNTMQSLDSNSSSKAVITAAVVDLHGKPVPDQNIPIHISNIINTTYSNASPYLESPDTQYKILNTGPDGYGYLTFYPGSFRTGPNNQTAQCSISATWGVNTSTVIAKWMNYNYLSVTTKVEPLNVEPDQNLTVCLYIDADGPSLSSKPIDLILCTNRGTSMLKDMYWQDNSSNFEDKMVYLYSAGQYLLQYLNTDPSTEDRAGIVSFGSMLTSQFPDFYPGDDNKQGIDDTDYIKNNYKPGHSSYSDFSYTDLPLTNNTAIADSSIKNITPYGEKMAKNHVPMRYGLYEAIQELNGHGSSSYRNNTIKAIILLADNEWDDFGDPTAGADNTSSHIDKQHGYYLNEKNPYEGANFPEGGISAWTAFESFDDNNVSISKSDDRQNLAYYAAENGIHIFSVAYFKKGNKVPDKLEERLRYMAYLTDGDYYLADSGEGLAAIFDKIGKRLRQEASVNTTAVLNFTSVQVGSSEIGPGSEFFKYLPIDGVSTYIQKCNGSSCWNETRNDSTNWTDLHELTFDLGTLYKGDHWSSCFTLQSKENTSGLVHIIGEGSEIIINGSKNISIPSAFPYVQPIRYGDQPTQNLTITYFNVSDSFTTVFDIDYTGNKTVHVKLYYQKLGDISSGWKQYASMNYQCNDHNCEGIHGEGSINKWILGTGQFMFKIEAWASDTPMATAQDGPKEIKRKYYIWLE
jgi:hypothetical protein